MQLQPELTDNRGNQREKICDIPLEVLNLNRLHENSAGFRLRQVVPVVEVRHRKFKEFRKNIDSRENDFVDIEVSKRNLIDEAERETAVIIFPEEGVACYIPDEVADRADKFILLSER